MSGRHWTQHYIDGAWTSPSSSADIAVLHSVTEEVIETAPAGTVADVEHAAEAASRALPGWMASSLEERAGMIYALADGIRARVDELGPLISAEVGMPIEGARGYQVLRAADIMCSFPRTALELTFEEQIGHSLVVKEPVGVVGAIAPSNFPLLLSLNKVGAALSAGCTVVLKPPETTPGTLLHLAEVAHEVGLPPGVLNVVSGYGPVVGEALATSPVVDMISFTGSTDVGRRLLELGSQTIKRAHLELGGKSAALVLDDADLGDSLEKVVGQAFINAGQICFAWSRVVVPRDRVREAEEILAGLMERFSVGDPLDTATTLGPLTTAVARDRVRRHVDHAVEQGARVVAGGSAAPEGLDHGYFVRPTVLGGVTPEMDVAQQEVFGPVLALLTHVGDQDAVRIGNDSVFGLHGAVFSADPDRAMSAARGLRTGAVDINGFKLGTEAPFGGFKQSGLGRELGRYGLEEYLEVKAIQT